MCVTDNVGVQPRGEEGRMEVQRVRRVSQHMQSERSGIPKVLYCIVQRVTKVSRHTPWPSAYIHMLTYTAWLIDRVVVLCVGLMKWMGMKGRASLYVCVCVRARI